MVGVKLNCLIHYLSHSSLLKVRSIYLQRIFAYAVYGGKINERVIQINWIAD